jgi:hypothetical protein
LSHGDWRAALALERYARRLPSSLEDLSGPATGTVVLPLQAAWSGRRAYDVSNERQRLVLYALLLAEAQREDLERFLPGDELEMDLLKEALGPRWITVQLAGGASVRALSLDDAVGLKARAWHDRFVIRDIIDLHAVAAAFSCADIENSPAARPRPGSRLRAPPDAPYPDLLTPTGRLPVSRKISSGRDWGGGDEVSYQRLAGGGRLGGCVR